MVNVNAKSPNKKRKSLPAQAGSPESPKKTKLNESVKTPGKNKNVATPGRTPRPQNNPKTPKKDGEQNAARTPKPTPKANKRASESEGEAPPKVMQKFAGTAALDKPKQKRNAKALKEKRRSNFTKLKEKVHAGDKAALQSLEEKIQQIESRTEKTKTARRKLKLLLKLKDKLLGVEKPPPAPQKKNQKAKAQHSVQPAQGQKKPGKNQQKQAPPAEDSDEESSDYEVDAEIQPDKIIKTGGESDEEESDDDESGEEEEEEDSDEEEEIEVAKGKKPQTKQGKSPDLEQLKENKIVTKGQKRYVLFVGNLPYDATRAEISEHFAKAGEVRHIRIPNDTKTNRPRGFAYVEFNDEIAYQKGLSLHHTSIKGRRINVLYTQGGKKKNEGKKNEVKVKNLKLHAMRKQGQLAGSVKQNQKRGARRNKKATVNGS